MVSGERKREGSDKNKKREKIGSNGQRKKKPKFFCSKASGEIDLQAFPKGP